MWKSYRDEWVSLQKTKINTSLVLYAVVENLKAHQKNMFIYTRITTGNVDNMPIFKH